LSTNQVIRLTVWSGWSTRLGLIVGQVRRQRGVQWVEHTRPMHTYWRFTWVACKGCRRPTKARACAAHGQPLLHEARSQGRAATRGPQHARVRCIWLNTRVRASAHSCAPTYTRARAHIHALACTPLARQHPVHVCACAGATSPQCPSSTSRPC